MKIVSSRENLSIFDPETITNIYLWGEKEIPSDLYDRVKTSSYLESLPTVETNEGIVKVIEIVVDGSAYMQDGAGRFARLSQYELVVDFFETDGLAEGIYSYSEIISQLNS